jgi:hypothetical protein
MPSFAVSISALQRAGFLTLQSRIIEVEHGTITAALLNPANERFLIEAVKAPVLIEVFFEFLACRNLIEAGSLAAQLLHLGKRGAPISHFAGECET